MEKKPILITDFDGTLLTDNKQILDCDLKAIEEFKRAGGLFGIATGRTIQGARQYFDLLKPDIPCIFYNGSLVYDISAKEVIMQKNLSERDIEIADEISREFPEAMIEILRVDEIYAYNINEAGRHQLEICNEKLINVEYENMPKTGWLKVLFAAEPKIIGKIEKFIRANYRFKIAYVRSDTNYIEILPSKSTKGSAVGYLSEKYFGDKYDVITMGDYYNDIEMLKFADFSGAPANAPDEVRLAAGVELEEDNNSGAISSMIKIIMKKYF